MKKHTSLLTKADIDWLVDSMKLVFPTNEKFDKKVDRLDEKLDTFIGEMKAFREEQMLHAGQHRQINDRFDRLEKKVGIATQS